MGKEIRRTSDEMGPLTLIPNRVALYVPPIQWKGDPTGHVGKMDTFFWVVAGECYVTIEQESFLVKPGQLAFLPRGKMRTYSSLSDDLVMYEMNFTARIQEENWYVWLGMNFSDYVIDIPDIQSVSRWFETSLRYEMNKSVAYDLLWCANLTNILTAYVTERTRRDKRVRPFREVIRFMDAQIHTTVTIEQLAAVACMQPTYFIRCFKEAFGTTPIAYFNKLKIYQAMKLLTSTDASMQSIAVRLGIADAAYFSRMFRKYCSISPIKYRQLFRGDTEEV